MYGTVDGSEILHQLRLVVYPIIYKVSYIPGGARFLPSTVSQNFPPNAGKNIPYILMEHLGLFKLQLLSMEAFGGWM